jgi:ribosomal protein S18 acetylase RimI-like enzyme
MELRDATPADIPQIRGVAEASWTAAYAAFLTPGQCRRALDDLYDSESLERAIEDLDDLHLVVAESEQEVVGFASAEKTWADEAELYALYISPDYWEAGIGSALLDMIVDLVRRDDVERLACSVFSKNYAGVGFFEANGFERLGETTTDVAGSVHEEYELERRV